MDQTINLALQILPKTTHGNDYEVIDKAIEVIQQSGLKYMVCPFETVIEGPYDEVMDVVKRAQDICFKYGADGLIANLKIQRSRDKNVSIEDKIGKYRK
jgi:uncharacterized protein YqgV (UPF0045/DUF77 family)